MVRGDGPWLPVWFGAAPAVAYIASWSGWFATTYGYDRNGTALNGGHPASTVIAWLQYQKSMLSFGLGLHAGQSYKSNPLGWLVLARPISFYSACLLSPNAAAREPPNRKCWRSERPRSGGRAAIALLACAVWWVARREWRLGSVLVGVAAGWLPWIWFYWHDHRTEFYYYAVVFEPFLIIAITLCLGRDVGPVRADPTRRAVGAVIGGAYMLLVLANFAYLYPVVAPQAIPYSSWLSRMWFFGWI